MKKFAWIFAAALLALSLAGCDTTDTVSEPEVSETTGYTVDYDAMSEEDARVRRVSDQVVREEYGFADLSVFEIKVTKYEWDGSYSVNYTLKIQNYTSGEYYVVKLTEDCKVERSYGSAHQGDYSRYLEAATEEAVKAAEERLKESTRDYDDSGYYYLSIDDDDNLCLSAEIIVHLDPSEYEGRDDMLDHRHVFFTEIICPAP